MKPLTQRQVAIVKYLEAAGEYRTGAQIVADCGLSCSRDAVYQSIYSIRRRGYRIDSTTSDGFCLRTNGDGKTAAAKAPLHAHVAAVCCGMMELLDPLGREYVIMCLERRYEL